MTKEEFINEVAKSVIKYAPQFNIKVCSPIIAQACLESAYGTSHKAQYHNYFGLKYRANRVTCHSGYFNDNSVEHNTDGSYTPINTDWYKFESLDKGILGYFQFTNISIYNNVKGVTEPKEYITRLRNDGYATDLQYVDKVMKVINDNNLTRFDNINKGEIKMSYTFRQNMVSSSKYSIKCPYSMEPQYITIHNTANSASADAEVRYMISNNNQVSYHVCVDEKEVIQAIPFNRNAWHAGDGASGTGNRKSIGIEIARSTGDANLFEQAERNCAAYVAKLLKERGWGIDRVKRHKDWSGKNCPHKTMEKGWQRFLNMIQAELNKLNGASQPKPQPSQPSPQPSTGKFKVGNYGKKVVTTDNLNVRRSRNAGSELLITIPKGTTIQVNYIMYQDNSVAPKGDLWGGVTYKGATGFINLKYVKPVTATTTSGKTVNYRVRITADSLNVRKEPNASAKITTTVKKGNVFTIVEEKNGWGKLKSGAGWINLSYTKKL